MGIINCLYHFADFQEILMRFIQHYLIRMLFHFPPRLMRNHPPLHFLPQLILGPILILIPIPTPIQLLRIFHQQLIRLALNQSQYFDYYYLEPTLLIFAETIQPG